MKNSLFLVGLIFSSRWNCSPDHACQNDDSQEVRKHIRKLGGNIRSENTDRRLYTGAKAKDQGAYERAKWIPFAKDHGSQTDETQAVGHLGIEYIH